VNDPREHREGGDGDGGAEEEGDLEEARMVREQPRHVRQPRLQRERQHERHRDAGPRHGHRAAATRTDMDGLELGADQKHVYAHAHPAADVQHVQVVFREQGHLRVGQHGTEQRRAQHHAGDHFADHLRLADALGELSDQAAREDDHARLQKELDGQLWSGHSDAPARCVIIGAQDDA